MIMIIVVERRWFYKKRKIKLKKLNETGVESSEAGIKEIKIKFHETIGMFIFFVKPRKRNKSLWAKKWQNTWKEENFFLWFVCVA